MWAHALATNNSRARPILEVMQKKLEPNGQKHPPRMLNGVYISTKGESLMAHQLHHAEKSASALQQQIAGSAGAALTDRDMSLPRKIAGCLQWAARSAAPMHAATAANL